MTFPENIRNQLFSAAIKRGAGSAERSDLASHELSFGCAHAAWAMAGLGETWIPQLVLAAD